MKREDAYPKEVNLDNCAREPIHSIGKIQEFGLLIVADINTFKITQCSENVPEFLPWSPDELSGSHLSDILGASITDQYQKELSNQVSHSAVEYQVNNKKFLLMAHRSQGHLLIDMEPQREDPTSKKLMHPGFSWISERKAAARIFFKGLHSWPKPILGMTGY